MSKDNGYVKMHASDVLDGILYFLEEVKKMREERLEKLIEKTMKPAKFLWWDKTIKTREEAIDYLKSFGTGSYNEIRRIEIYGQFIADDMMELQSAANVVINKSEPYVYVPVRLARYFEKATE